MKKQAEDNAINRYIRERIKLARKNAGENQSELAKILKTTYASVSDMERGRTAINASVLMQIAHHYKKSISYFFPDETIIKLSRLEEELLEIFKELPATEQFREIDHLREKLKSIKKKKEKNKT